METDVSKYVAMANKTLRSYEKETGTVFTKHQVEEFMHELLDINASKMNKLLYAERVKLKAAKYKRIDPAVVELLVRCIELDDPIMREGSAILRHMAIAKLGMTKEWGKRGSIEIAGFFLQIFQDDPDESLREEARVALWNLYRLDVFSETFFARVLNAMEEIQHGVCLENAVQFFYEPRNRRWSPRAVEPLVRALKDKDESVREKAARALGTIRDARAVQPLILTLRDKEAWVRQAAAEALGEIGDARAAEPLTPVLKDKYQVVSETAKKALRKIKAKKN